MDSWVTKHKIRVNEILKLTLPVTWGNVFQVSQKTSLFSVILHIKTKNIILQIMYCTYEIEMYQFT
jgi:hypothetical protein